MKIILSTLVGILYISFASAQLKINTSVTAHDIVKRIVASDILVTEVTSGTFKQGSSGLIYNGENTSLGMVNGAALTTGYLSAVPNDADGTSHSAVGTGNNSYTTLLKNLPGAGSSFWDVADVQFVQFKFISQCNAFGIRYIFGSEEYEEWINSIYNDRFGLFIKPAGAPVSSFINVAVVPTNSGNVPVTINTVNDAKDAVYGKDYYINNQQSASIMYDGLTNPLVGNTPITAGQEYTVLLIIGDVGDAIFDSGVFLFGKGTGCYDGNTCGINSVPFTTSNCNSSNQFSVSGNIVYERSGGPFNLIVEYDGQQLSQTFTGITSGNNISINNLIADGNYHWLTYRMGDKSSCRKSILIKAPDPCTPCSLTNIILNTALCDNTDNTYDLTGQVHFSARPKTGHLVVTNKYQSWLYPVSLLPANGTTSFSIDNLPSNNAPENLQAYFTDNLSCKKEINYTAPASCYTPTIPCSTCIGSFAPQIGVTYVLSAWVKVENAPPTVHTYTNADIQLEFLMNGGGVQLITPMLGKNKIIEGWQKIEEEFTVPSNSLTMAIKLRTTAAGGALFDDIRIYPKDGNLKSFVYDPISMKLVAELDENNYASFYEYDEEGGLIRVKKETERGVVTLKEHRTHMKKD